MGDGSKRKYPDLNAFVSFVMEGGMGMRKKENLSNILFCLCMALFLIPLLAYSKSNLTDSNATPT